MEAMPLARMREVFPAWKIRRDLRGPGFTAVHWESGRTITATTLADLADQITAADREDS